MQLCRSNPLRTSSCVKQQKFPEEFQLPLKPRSQSQRHEDDPWRQRYRIAVAPRCDTRRRSPVCAATGNNRQQSGSAELCLHSLRGAMSAASFGPCFGFICTGIKTVSHHYHNSVALTGSQSLPRGNTRHACAFTRLSHSDRNDAFQEMLVSLYIDCFPNDTLHCVSPTSIAFPFFTNSLSTALHAASCVICGIWLTAWPCRIARLF